MHRPSKADHPGGRSGANRQEKQQKPPDLKKGLVYMEKFSYIDCVAFHRFGAASSLDLGITLDSLS
jgi:hypothetical protein